MEAPRPGRTARFAGAAGAALLGVAVALAGCSLPWREYRVAPAVSGRLVRGGAAVASGRVRLQVRSFDNAALGRHVEQELPAHGGFFFDELALRVAGREYGKRYVLLLYWIPAAGPEASGPAETAGAVTLWRADYARGDLGAPIELVCSLDRPELQGPPCRFVGDATEQPWLLAAGRRDYVELCASCHGSDGRGNGPATGGLPTPVPDLRRIAARQGGVFPLEEIAAWIDGRPGVAAPPVAHGPREMPVWGVRLSEQYVPGGFTKARIRNRIDILVQYLDSLQEPGATP